MERKSAEFVDQKIFCGFLEMETKENSGVFHRLFLRLDPDASTLEYFADREQVLCSYGSFILCFRLRLFHFYVAKMHM